MSSGSGRIAEERIYSIYQHAAKYRGICGHNYIGLLAVLVEFYTFNCIFIADF